MANLEDMMKRQKVLGDFGDFALRCDDLQDILDEACRLVGRALDTDFAKIIEIEKGGRELLVRAGAGWRDGIVGQTRLPMNEKSSETYSISHASPVIVNDITNDDRFEFPPFLRDHGVVSMVNVPIIIPGGGAYGLLQVDARSYREFGNEDIEFLRTYAAVLGPVIDRLHKEHSLRLALETNQRLLSELQHRVKNHIAIISSLVGMRARQVSSDDARLELEGLNARIETLRLVHEQLYVAGTSERLRLRPFIMKLVESLCHFHTDTTGSIRLEFAVDELHLEPEVAVPLGMILNEFVTNSIKYAFDNGNGSISVSVNWTGEHLHFSVSDSGNGLPTEPSDSPRGSGTGMKLIKGLAGQIGAEPQWRSSEQGTVLTLHIPHHENS